MLEFHIVQHVSEATPYIDQSQFGGRKASSTTHALLKILHPVYKAVDDSKNYARLLLIDFSKAFDHIDHHILLEKLGANGVPDIICRWYAHFLYQRQQRIKIGMTTSNWQSINGGVPQGTISGPELFVQMVSDLKPPLENIKYMDDTTLVEIASKNNPSVMQNSADQICAWSRGNKLAINATKTKEIVISFGKQPTVENIHMENTPIERVTNAKLLGVIISNDLKWSEQVKNINAKASRRLFYLRCLKRAGLTESDLRRVYTTLIRPVCEYACPVWSPSLTSEQRNIIESIQKRALKIIRPQDSYDEACTHLNLPSLCSRRDNICASFFDNMKLSSHSLHNLLPPKRQCDYRLRNHSTYPKPKCKTNRYKNSFIPWCLFNCQ